MPGINRIPTGILGFLGIKNFGRNPEEVAGYLQPTWDYQRWYLETNAQFRNQAVSFNAVGFFAAFQVPTNEVWAVHSLSCLGGPLGAGQQLNIQPAIANQSSNIFTILPQVVSRVAATVGSYAVCSASYPFVLGPGEVAGYFCSDLAAGPVGATGAIRYTVMQA